MRLLVNPPIILAAGSWRAMMAQLEYRAFCDSRGSPSALLPLRFRAAVFELMAGLSPK